MVKLKTTRPLGATSPLAVRLEPIPGTYLQDALEGALTFLLRTGLILAAFDDANGLEYTVYHSHMATSLPRDVTAEELRTEKVRPRRWSRHTSGTDIVWVQEDEVVIGEPTTDLATLVPEGKVS